MIARSLLITLLILSLLQDVLFAVNVQHDCFTSQCSTFAHRAEKQEREDAGKTLRYLQHNNTEYFVLNTHGFHNVHLLRQVLPATLIKPQPWAANREVLHRSLSEKFATQTKQRDSEAQKRRKQKQKEAELHTDEGVGCATSVLQTTKRRRVEAGEDI